MSDATSGNSAEEDALEALLRRIASTPEVDPGVLGIVGRGIGHYDVTDRIGRGGMGVVYRARDRRLDRDVALKMLNADDAGDVEHRVRFMREAQSAAAITHPHVAAIYDIGECDGLPYIAMELVRGPTLRAWLDDKPRAEAEVLDVAEQVAEALAAAHRAGVVHRDLKPENVMLTTAGQAKVLDFGLAKVTSSASAPGGKATLSTDHGQVIGTPPYMAPEQAAGRGVDARADIFAFGSLLYEMLGGERPFRGATAMEVMAAVQATAHPPLPSRVSAPVRRLVDRCLEKKPDARFIDGTELLRALREIRETPSRGKAIALAGVALTVAMGMASVVPAAYASLMLPEVQPSFSSIPVVAEDDTYLQGRFTLGVQAFYAGDFAAARSVYDEVVADRSNDPQLLSLGLVLAQVAYRGDEKERALADVENVLMTGGPLSALVFRCITSRGFDMHARDAVSDAELGRDVSAFIDDHPTDYFASLLVSAVAPNDGDIDKRMRWLDSLIALDPRPALPYLLKSWGLRRAGLADGALAAIEAGLRAAPGNAALRSEHAHAQLTAGRLAEADESLGLLLAQRPGDLFARLDRAEARFLLGDEAEWKRDLNRVLGGTFPSYPAGRGVLFHTTLLTARGRFKEAAPLSERAMEAVLKGEGGVELALDFLSRRAEEDADLEERAGLVEGIARLERLNERAGVSGPVRERLIGALWMLRARHTVLDGALAPDVISRALTLETASFRGPLQKRRGQGRLRFEAALKRGDAAAASAALRDAWAVEDGQPMSTGQYLDEARLARSLGDEGAASSALAEVAKTQATCLKATLFWEISCRHLHARAATLDAELAQRRGDAAGAEAALRRLNAVWVAPDADLVVARRASAVGAWLRAAAATASPPAPLAP